MYRFSQYFELEKFREDADDNSGNYVIFYAKEGSIYRIGLFDKNNNKIVLVERDQFEEHGIDISEIEGKLEYART